MCWCHSGFFSFCNFCSCGYISTTRPQPFPFTTNTGSDLFSCTSFTAPAQITVSILHLFVNKVMVFDKKMVVTIRSLSLQLVFAQRFNEVTCDITHISSLEENRKYPIEHAELQPDSGKGSCSVSETSRWIVCARWSSPTLHRRIQGRRCTGH